MNEQAPNRTARSYAYDSPEHEVQYFRGLMEKTLSRSRMSTSSEGIGELTKALVKAQKNFGTPKRTVQGQVGNHRYNYADLQSVYDAVREPLAANGLCVTHLMQEFVGQVELVTMLLHESGEYLRSVYPIKGHADKPQSFGSAVTYAKRYSLSALLGIASEEDDDAAGAETAAKAAGRDPELRGAVDRATQKAAQAPGGPDLSIMSPDTGEIEWSRTKATAGDVREFLRQLETACSHSALYWAANGAQARALAEKRPNVKVDDETLAKMVERLEGMYGGQVVEEGGASPLM